MSGSDNEIRGIQLLALRRLYIGQQVHDGVTIAGSTLKSVLRAIADHGDVCWASTGTIADETCYCERTIRRSLKCLNDSGLITIEARPGQTSILRINWESIQSRTSAIVTAVTPVIVAEVGQLTPVTQSNTPVTQSNTPVTQSSTPVTVTDKTKETKETKRNKSLRPPTLEEVRVLWEEEHLHGTPKDFFNYYDGVDWVQGASQTPITNWKAVARRWADKTPRFETQKRHDGANYDPTRVLSFK